MDRYGTIKTALRKSEVECLEIEQGSCYNSLTQEVLTDLSSFCVDEPGLPENKKKM